MPVVDLYAELWGAMQLAERARLELIDDRLVQSLPATVPWGVGVVEYYGADLALYEPQPKGRPAIIVPVIEDGDTVDLLAVDMHNGHAGRRFGHGVALGADAIERARWGGCILLLVRRPLDWVRRQPLAWDGAQRFIAAAHNQMQNPADHTGDTSRPDDFAYLFDIRRVVKVTEGVRPDRIKVEGLEFYEQVYRLFPPSVRDQLMCRA